MIKLYDGLIDRLNELTEGLGSVSYPYRKSAAWPETKDYEVILQRDTALELGGSGRSNANYMCVTTEQSGIQIDEVRVFGPDLQEIHGPVDFARVCEIVVSEGADTDPETKPAKLHRLLQDIDFVKYHIYPSGYMIRTSGQSPREQIRVSRSALQDGISFEAVGNAYIRHYKENPAVLHVRVNFFTTPDMDYRELQKSAKTAADIKNSLSDITKGLPKDCGSCGAREICDSIEGLRELHFGRKAVP